jgi:hypothetical protein
METDKQFIINYTPTYEVRTTKPKQTTTYGHAVKWSDLYVTLPFHSDQAVSQTPLNLLC